VLQQMHSLERQYKRKELIAQFDKEDFAAWPEDQAKLAAEAFHIRGRNYWVLKRGKESDADLQAAVRLAPRNGQYWMTLADNASRNLNDPEAALAAYDKTYEISGGGNGWLPLGATLGAANVLVSDLRTDEALKVLERYENLDSMAKSWRIRMLRAFGKVLAAQGQDAEALAKFREANVLEKKGAP